ncbi:MAG: NADH-quinone oxidoreductase subunit L [Anaerolineae bacterium]|nr:NADH-quinone oxidoreductase subunit L [Anaerolineae bacterium]
MAAWLIVLTIGLPWLGALIVWRTGDQRPRAQNMVAIGFAVAGGIAALALIPFASEAVAISLPSGGVFGDFTFKPDGLAVFLAAIASVIGSLTVIFSVDYMRSEKQLGRYYTLVLLFIGGMSGLVLTNSLLLLFLFWELVAFCSYALISFYNDDPKAVAGGIKALVITQIGGVGLLVGVLVATATLGNSQIDYLLANTGKIPVAALSVIAFGFLLGGAAKSAQVPFHTWLPGAMEAPTPVSALIHAATMVNAGVYLLARFYPAFANVPGWTTAVITIGMLSALLAACMALVSTDLKRILAYSTISQLGYMVYAVGTGAIFASQFHLFSHAVFKALLFLGAGAVIHAVGTRDILRMGGLGKQMPFVRAVFGIGMLALAGVPIFNGFWSKELILEAGSKGALWPYLAMLVGVFLTALYSVRMMLLTFYGKPCGTTHAHDAPQAMRIALGVLAFGTLTTWLLGGALSQLLESTLPFHALHAEPLGTILGEVLTAPLTLVALLAVALGAVVWFMRDRWLNWLVNLLQAPAYAAANDFGFEWINRQIVSLTQRCATWLRTFQTGQLNWNVAGIVIGLIVVLAILTAGATGGGIH